LPASFTSAKKSMPGPMSSRSPPLAREAAQTPAKAAAARLWQEFLYSDEGQNIWLGGGARPVRLPSMEEAGTADEELLSALPPVEGTAEFPTQEQETAAQQVVADRWNAEISG